jgi:hypothetical protein
VKVSRLFTKSPPACDTHLGECCPHPAGFFYGLSPMKSAEPVEVHRPTTNHSPLTSSHAPQLTIKIPYTVAHRGIPRQSSAQVVAKSPRKNTSFSELPAQTFEPRFLQYTHAQFLGLHVSAQNAVLLQLTSLPIENQKSPSPHHATGHGPRTNDTGTSPCALPVPFATRINRVSPSDSYRQGHIEIPCRALLLHPESRTLNPRMRLFKQFQKSTSLNLPLRFPFLSLQASGHE